MNLGYARYKGQPLPDGSSQWLGICYAAAESQSFGPVWAIDQSQFAYNNLVIRTGCASDQATLACLRSLDTTSLQYVNFNTLMPTAQTPSLYLDGDLVPDYTYRLFQRTRHANFPGSPAWKTWGDGEDYSCILIRTNDTVVAMVPVAQQERCDYWVRIGTDFSQ